MSALRLPIDTADLAAEAYGRRRLHWPVIDESYGLAVVLIMNRNTEHDRGVWLTHDDVSNALCEAAEAFAGVLTGRSSPEGWRAAALASLRTLDGWIHRDVPGLARKSLASYA